MVSKFLRGGARPRTQDEMVFVNANKDDIVEDREMGVELICRVLQVAQSTYYAARGRVPSARTLNNPMLPPQLFDLWEDDFQMYRVRKLWKAALGQGLILVVTRPRAS